MIGGVDVIFDTGLPTSRSLEIAACTVTRLWANAVFQDAISGEVFSACDSIPFPNVHELLCYRDEGARLQWDAVGADTSTDDKMIHLLAYDARRLTAVVGNDKSGDARAYLEALRQAFADRVSPLKHIA
jgi:hypothetical protein